MNEENERVKWAEQLDGMLNEYVLARDALEQKPVYKRFKEMARLADRYEETQRPIGYMED